MCNYENITFACGHSKRGLIKYCHFARTDPDHNCFGAWSIKRERRLPLDNCRDCIAAGAPRTIQPPQDSTKTITQKDDTEGEKEGRSG